MKRSQNNETLPTSGVTQILTNSLGVSKLLVQIGQAQGSSLSTVVVVPVQVQDSLSVHGQQSTDNALSQTSSQDDGIVFTIGQGFTASGHPIEVLLGALLVAIIVIVVILSLRLVFRHFSILSSSKQHRSRS